MSTQLCELVSATLAPSNSGKTLGELLGLPTKGKTRESVPAVFPLQRVVVNTRIVGDCAHTTLVEHYSNPHARPMDVTHTIPLPFGAAVIAFELTSGTRVAKGLCKRMAEAKSDFASALARGKTAAMVESVRDDVHTISLGNVPAKSNITVRMELVEKLTTRDGTLEYRFPTAISPKFVPGTPIGHTGEGTSPDTDQAPDASFLSPPIRLEGGTSLQFSLVCEGAHCNIKSNAALLVKRQDDQTTASLAPEATCSRDVVLRFDSRESKTALRAYTDGERTLVVVHPPSEAQPSLEQPLIASFVLDRSGSMSGERIDAAKRAIASALKALRETDSFELIAFDDEAECFSEKACVASPKNVKKALGWLAKIDARGGTVALPALVKSCTTAVPTSVARTVLFVTDGDVGNDQELLEVTRHFDPATRLFVLGIGLAPSNAMLSRLARLGGGSYLALEDGDDIEAEMTRFRLECNGPMAMNLREVGATKTAHCDLFAGRSSSFFIEASRASVSIEGSDGAFVGKCTVVRTTLDLGSIWARGIIERLEDRIISEPESRDELEEHIAQLGVKHRLLTRFTSFVAVDEQSNVHGEPIAIAQPTDRVDDQALTCFSLKCSPITSCDDIACYAEPTPRFARAPRHDRRRFANSMVSQRNRATSVPPVPNGFTTAPTGRRALDWTQVMSPAPSIHHAIQILYWGFSSGEDQSSPLWLQIEAILQAAIEGWNSSQAQVEALKNLRGGIQSDWLPSTDWELASSLFPPTQS